MSYAPMMLECNGCGARFKGCPAGPHQCSDCTPAGLAKRVRDLETIVGMFLAVERTVPGPRMRLEDDQDQARGMIWARNSEARKRSDS